MMKTLTTRTVTKAQAVKLDASGLMIGAVGLISLTLLLSASGDTAEAASDDCAFTGPPAVAYVRRTDEDPQWAVGQELVIADSRGRCQMVVYRPDPAAGSLLTSGLSFRYLPNDAGGGTGILVWMGSPECPVGDGLFHATIDVGADGSIVGPNPIRPTLYCADENSAGRLTYPSISPAADRLSFIVSDFSGSSPDVGIYVAPGPLGGSLAGGIDLDGAELVGRVSRDVSGTTWSPSGTALYFAGRLEPDESDNDIFVYELTEGERGWDSRKLDSVVEKTPSGSRQEAAHLTAAAWDYDGAGPREVLAYVLKTVARSTELRIIDVNESSAGEPAVISTTPTSLTHPSFSSITIAGKGPNLFMLDTADPGLPILEVDPATGRCVPERACVTYGPAGSMRTQPAAGLGTWPAPQSNPGSTGLQALPAILDLILDDDSRANTEQQK
jgi:hypothetical protein